MAIRHPILGARIKLAWAGGFYARPAASHPELIGISGQ